MNPLSAHTIDNFLSGKASTKEKAQIEAWYKSFDEQTSLTKRMTEEEREKTASKMWDAIAKAVQFEYCKLSNTGS